MIIEHTPEVIVQNEPELIGQKLKKNGSFWPNSLGENPNSRFIDHYRSLQSIFTIFTVTSVLWGRIG